METRVNSHIGESEIHILTFTDTSAEKRDKQLTK